MPILCLIVCERTGRWAAALAREFSAIEARGRPIPRIAQSRSVTECREALQESPCSVAVVELTPGHIDAALELLATIDRDLAQVRVVVVAADECVGYERIVRELGAVHVVFSPRELQPIAESIAAYLSGLPQEAGGLTERIMADLPWGP